MSLEQDAPGYLLEAVAEQLDHCRHHAFERDRTGQVLQPADARLRAQIIATLRQPPHRHFERGIGSERIAVITVGIAASPDSGSSRQARAVPGRDRAGLRCNRPGALRSPAAARSRPAAISPRPRSSGRGRRSSAPACPRPVASPAESPYLRPWRAQTPLASIGPALATESYVEPMGYVAPASPLRQTDELSRLGPLLGLVQGHGGANESLQRRLVDGVALVEVDGAPCVPVETGVEEARRI